MRNVVLCLATGALAAGCSLFAPGSVEVPAGVDDFGTVRSANWVVVTSNYDGDIDVDNSLVVSSDGGYCRKAQNAYDELTGAYEEFYEDFYGLYEDLKRQYGGDYKGFYTALNRETCKAASSLFETYADATNGIINDTNIVTLETVTFETGKYGVSDEPREGTFSAPEGYYDDSYYFGSVAFYDENPYQAALDELEEVDCDSLGPYDYFYKLIKPAYSEPIRIDGGELVLEENGDDAFRGELTGASLGEASGFELEANFKRCDISVSGYVYFLF